MVICLDRDVMSQQWESNLLLAGSLSQSTASWKAGLAGQLALGVPSLPFKAGIADRLLLLSLIYKGSVDLNADLSTHSGSTSVLEPFPSSSIFNEQFPAVSM